MKRTPRPALPPPRLARRLLAWFTPGDLRPAFLDDLDETFGRRAADRGYSPAAWWYRRQVAASAWSFVALRRDRRRRVGSDATRAATLGQDLREAARALRRRPLMTAATVASLALGIGASASIFSVVNGILLRPLDLESPDRLVLVGERMPGTSFDEKFPFFVNPAAFLAWRSQATDLSGVAAVTSSLFTLTGAGAPRLLYGARVSTNFFGVLEVGPALGRLLIASDAQDAARPMIITDALWRSAFHSDPTVVGRRVGAGTAAATIVGVLPPTFRIGGPELGPMLAGEPTEFFEALRFQPNERITAVYSDFNYSVVGRLRPCVTMAETLAQLDGIQMSLARQAPEHRPLFARLSPVQEVAVSSARAELWLLLGGVLAVLLIVCVNLGGLSVTRVSAQRREWAIRGAMGAAPGRLVRQVLGENVLTALAGGALGIVTAASTLQALVAMAPADLPRVDEIRMDWRVVAFGLLISIAAGLVTGLVPAVRLTRVDPVDTLKATGAATTTDRASLRTGRALIGLQAAMSTVLLVTAGLLGVSFYRLARQPTGFSARHGVTADVTLGAAYTETERDRILQQLPRRLLDVPGVTEAAFTSHLPLEGETWISAIAVPGRGPAAGDESVVNTRFVSAGYFSTIGTPILAGREIDERDRPKVPATSAATEPPGVVVLGRAAARMLWPNDPLNELPGRALTFQGHTVYVVGIAADARATLASAAPPMAYSPYWEQTPYRIALVARSTTTAAAIAGQLRAAVWDLAPLAPVPTVRPLDDLAAAATAPERYRFSLLLLFAAVALLLAALGVYALVADHAARRRRELALRLTMGARAGDLWRSILRQGLMPVAAGVAAGVLGALAGARLIAALLFETSAVSPIILAAAASAVLGAACAACVLSARGAVGADPWSALRSE